VLYAGEKAQLLGYFGFHQAPRGLAKGYAVLCRKTRYFSGAEVYRKGVLLSQMRLAEIHYPGSTLDRLQEGL
jgi:hypothetical protein